LIRAAFIRHTGAISHKEMQMSSEAGGICYQDAHLTVDAAGAAAHLDGQLLSMTRKEFQLLVMLVQHAGELVPREKLLTDIWGYQSGVRSRTLDVHVRRVRRHLGKFANLYIETIFGKGYRFQPRVQTDSKTPPGLFRLRLRLDKESAAPIV
jgi:DNA-binding response OmpR family regulator